MGRQKEGMEPERETVRQLYRDSIGRKKEREDEAERDGEWGVSLSI